MGAADDLHSLHRQALELKKARKPAAEIVERARALDRQVSEFMELADISTFTTTRGTIVIRKSTPEEFRLWTGKGVTA